MIKEKIYQGTRKNLYSTGNEYSILLSFHDGMHAQGSKVKISGKAALCNSISAFLMERLDMVGIENHFLDKVNACEQLVQFTEAYPVQAVISNVATGRYIKNFGIEEGMVFDSPIIDFRIKNNELGYPSVNEDQIYNFGWMNKFEIKELKKQTVRVNDFLSGLFASCGIRLVEANLEFGRIFNGEEFIIMLIDELSPDNLTLWDIESNKRLSCDLLDVNGEADSTQKSDSDEEVDHGAKKSAKIISLQEPSSNNTISSYKEVLKRLGVR